MLPKLKRHSFRAKSAGPQLPESEKFARAQAGVVMLLGLYGASQTEGGLGAIAQTALCFVPAVLAYGLYPRVGHVMYWSTVLCCSPPITAVIVGDGTGALERTFIEAHRYIGLALVFGLTRLLGFGGPSPLFFGAIQVRWLRP